MNINIFTSSFNNFNKDINIPPPIISHFISFITCLIFIPPESKITLLPIKYKFNALGFILVGLI